MKLNPIEGTKGRGPSNKTLEKRKEIDEFDVDEKLKQFVLEGKVERYTFGVGGKTAEEYKKELLEKNIPTAGGSVNELLKKMSPSKNRESFDFVRLSLKV